jgi:hypothetical protein
LRAIIVPDQTPTSPDAPPPPRLRIDFPPALPISGRAEENAVSGR